MDDVDRNLITAWQIVCERCSADPVFAAKRVAMARRRMMRKPLRDFCLALRASDTRITDCKFYIHTKYAVEDKVAHLVDLNGESVRELLKPIENRWPGMLARHAAAKVGVCHEVIMRWAKRGVIKVEYYRPGSDGWWGPMAPYVSWSQAIDPQHMEGRRPDEVWGSSWLKLWERVPAEFHQTVQRVPRLRDDPRYGVVFSGWDWLCPGTVDGAGKWKACGRRCRWLYASVPVFRVQDFLGEAFPCPVGLPSQVGMGEADFRFACEKCVGWQGYQGSQRRPSFVWNKFVRHISGGLLFGHEVERPEGVCEWTRQKGNAKLRAAAVAERG